MKLRGVGAFLLALTMITASCAPPVIPPILVEAAVAPMPPAALPANPAMPLPAAIPGAVDPVLILPGSGVFQGPMTEEEVAARTRARCGDSNPSSGDGRDPCEGKTAVNEPGTFEYRSESFVNEDGYKQVVVDAYAPDGTLAGSVSGAEMSGFSLADGSPVSAWGAAVEVSGSHGGIGLGTQLLREFDKAVVETVGNDAIRFFQPKEGTVWGCYRSGWGENLQLNDSAGHPFEGFRIK